MNILLAACNAKYIHSNLAVYSLRAYAGEFREQIQLGEYTINQQKDEILRDIYKRQPDLLFFSCYIWNISFVREIIKDVKKILPDTVIWTGGPEVSYDGKKFLEEMPEVTGVMKGEGEATFQELLTYYEHSADTHIPLESIRGITWRSYAEQGNAQSECIIHENPWREILDLSTIPFPYDNLEEFKNKIIYYESSRGCPFSCSYCLSSVDKKLRFRSLDLVKKELQYFIDHKVRQVKFVDRTFNCKHEHAQEIWRYLIAHDNGETNFHFEVAADLITEEELELFKQMRPGLIQLEIGVQTTNPRTIDEIHRKMDLDKVKAIVKSVQDNHNIHQHLDLIAGLPYEDYNSFRESFNEIYALRPEQLQLGFLKVLKGSYMYEMAEHYDCVYQSREPYEVLATKWLSYEDILRLKQVENMVEVYYNSGQFIHTLPWVEEYYESPFDFYQQLGSFYERKHYDVISHSRMRRYDILLEFLRENEKVRIGEIQQSLLYDLYIRENLKSRPAWAVDQSPYSKKVREYMRENQIPKTSHIEVFASGAALLFEYDKRDPLNHQAKVTGVKL